MLKFSFFGCLLLLLTSISNAQDSDMDSEKILESGYFIEGVFASGVATSGSESYYTGGQTVYSFPMVGVRMGTKFYFGGPSNMAFGMNLNYARLMLGIVENTTYQVYDPYLNFAPIGLGAAWAYHFGNGFGMEVNGDFHVTIYGNSGESDMNVGITINPNIKFRYKVLAIGFDLGYVNGRNLNNINGRGEMASYGLSVGAKF